MFDIKSLDPDLGKKILQNGLFDYYRIVDVDTYTVYDWRDGKFIPQYERCYIVWRRGSACKNCISRAAVNGQRQIVKLETVDGRIYLTVSMPLTLGGRVVALELVKDVTNSLVINDASQTESAAFAGLIQRMNELVIRDYTTSLYNKRYVEQELNKSVLEWSAARPLVIAVLNAGPDERFLGRAIGDEIIRPLGKLLSECAAEGNGWAGRLSGNEFLLLFRDIPMDRAEELVKALRQKAGAQEWKQDGEPVLLGIGMAEYSMEIGSWKAFLDMADQNRYLDPK